jgi:hypothetical protein
MYETPKRPRIEVTVPDAPARPSAPEEDEPEDEEDEEEDEEDEEDEDEDEEEQEESTVVGMQGPKIMDILSSPTVGTIIVMGIWAMYLGSLWRS